MNRSMSLVELELNQLRVDGEMLLSKLLKTRVCAAAAAANTATAAAQRPRPPSFGDGAIVDRNRVGHFGPRAANGARVAG